MKNLSINKKIITVTGAMLVTLAFLAFFSAENVKANPSYFAQPVTLGGLGTATTTVSYIRAGSATTTLPYDSYYTNSLANYTKADSATLLVTMTASSTGSVLSTRIEYAWDQPGVNCVSTPLQCDWFPQTNLKTDPTVATTTYANTMTETYWSFASTTVGGATGLVGNATTSMTFSFPIKTPTRYMRVVFSAPVGSTGLGLWATIVPVKEKSE